MRTRAFWIAAVVTTLLALLGAWLVLAPDTGPTLTSMRADAQHSTDPVSAAGTSTAPSASRSGNPSASAGTTVGEPGAGALPTDAPSEPSSGNGAALPPLPDLDDPELAAAFVEARVLDLLGQIAPEIPAAEIHKRCSDDGKLCTFSAPWPGDDLVPRWVRAIGDGRTGKDRLQGVTFSRFGPVERDGQKWLEIDAAAPAIY